MRNGSLLGQLYEVVHAICNCHCRHQRPHKVGDKTAWCYRICNLRVGWRLSIYDLELWLMILEPKALTFRRISGDVWGHWWQYHIACPHDCSCLSRGHPVGSACDGSILSHLVFGGHCVRTQIVWHAALHCYLTTIWHWDFLTELRISLELVCRKRVAAEVPWNCCNIWIWCSGA